MASYNYGYPVTYSPYQIQQAQPMSQMMQQQPVYSQAASQPAAQGIIWVQGEAAAKAYPVPAGTNAVLMDSESQVFYIKATDSSGMPQPLRVFEYNEVVRTEPQNSNSAPGFDPNEYVSKEEFDELKKQIQNMNSNNYSRKDRNNNAKPSV